MPLAPLIPFQKQASKLDVLKEIPLESLTEEAALGPYISVMEKNLKALKQTTDQKGRSEPERKKTPKTVHNGTLSADVRTAHSDYVVLAVSIPFLEDGTLIKSLTTRLNDWQDDQKDEYKNTMKAIR